MAYSSRFFACCRHLWVMVLVVLLMSCSAPSSSSGSSETGTAPADSTTTTTSPSTPNSAKAQSKAEEVSIPGAQGNPDLAKLPQLQGEATVELQVKGQKITVAVNGQDAPITAGNFVDLVDQGVYDGTAFHRVVRDPSPFVVQGGDPQSKDPNFPLQRLGTGNFVDPKTKQPRYIPLEILPEGTDQAVYSKTFKDAGLKTLPKLKHVRGAVAMARSPLPDSASAQFYFTLADVNFLDGDYAVFGYVSAGLDVVDQIEQGDRIESAKITSGLENLKR